MKDAAAGSWKRLALAALFALCIAPTCISYQPYAYRWDDAEYLRRSIEVSRAVWSGNPGGLIPAMVSNRPPAMTLLGLPWGALTSWDAAGKCYFTLDASISFLAALCLYFMLRIGIKPLYLALASVCVFASLGPYPHGAAIAHSEATAFLADSLFAWTALAAVLLIPLESRTNSSMATGAVWRGILWASILSLGVMTKLNFMYFIALILPVLFYIRLRRCGLRNACDALIIYCFFSAPSTLYLLVCGKPAILNMMGSSFGGAANYYYIPLLKFLGDTIRESPGIMLSFVLTAAALTYLAIKKRLMLSRPDFIALLIVLGFGVIVFAATNRQIRYAFPVIVALPFLTAILISGKERPLPIRSAALLAGLVFCGLLAASVPVLHRADRQCLSKCDAVLAQALRCNSKHILLATDSPAVNVFLLDLAQQFSSSKASTATLAYEAMNRRPIAQDFSKMSESDLVVFQDREALSPAFSNQRVAEYERHIRQGGAIPIRAGDDVTVYATGCRP